MDPRLYALLTSLAAVLQAAADGSLDVPPNGHRLPDAAGQWLTPDEAASRMGVTARWLSRRWRKLPFCHPLPGASRGFRVNADELAKEMQRRR